MENIRPVALRHSKITEATFNSIVRIAEKQNAANKEPRKFTGVPMSRPLFSIGDDLRQLVDSVDDGEIQPDFEAIFHALEKEEGVKTDGYLNARKHLVMEADAAEKEADLYKAMAATRRRRVIEMDKRLMEYLQFTGRTELKTATGRQIKIVGNGGCRPMIMGDDVTWKDVPVEYVKMTPSIDNSAVRKVLESGEVLDFAKLGERGTRLKVG